MSIWQKRQAAAQAEILEKIEKSKNKRELHAKVKGKSMAELLREDESVSSAAAWVEKARNKVNSPKFQEKIFT